MPAAAADDQQPKIESEQRKLSLRVFLIACLWLVFSALLAHGLHDSWSSTWHVVGVNSLKSPFGDIRTIPNAVGLVHQGIDPYIVRPGYPTLNYPRIWVSLFGALHLDQHILVYEFTVITLLLLCFSHLILITRKTTSAILILAGCLSSATFLVVERGNTDMVAFVLTYLAAVTSLLALAAALFTLAAILKLYPAVALFPAAITRRRAAQWLLIGGVLFLAYVVLVHADISRIQRNTPHNFELSYGVSSISAELDLQTGHSFFKALTLFSLVLCPSLALWGIRTRGRRHLPSTPSERLFLIFAIVFLATFVLTPNYEYRLIFLIPTIPFWCEFPAAEPGRRLAIAGLILTILSLDSPLLRLIGPFKELGYWARVVLFPLESFFFGWALNAYIQSIPVPSFLSFLKSPRPDSETPGYAKP